MEARYQIIYQIICAWNMTFYMRIRDISKNEAEMLQNSSLLPFFSSYGCYNKKIELIKKTDYDYNYLVYTKSIFLSQFITNCVTPLLRDKFYTTLVRIKKDLTQEESKLLVFQHSLN